MQQGSLWDFGADVDQNLSFLPAGQTMGRIYDPDIDRPTAALL